MRILFLSRWFPYPPTNGSKIRVYNLLRGICQEHRVTLLSFYQPEDGEPDTTVLGAWCESIHTLPYQVFRPKSARAIVGFISTTPRAYLDTYSQEMQAKIEELLAESKFDLVMASQIDMAIYASHFQGLPAIFEEVEVGYFHDRFIDNPDYASRFRRGLTWVKHQRYIRKLLRYFKACTVVSRRERQILSNFAPEDIPIEVIPNSVDLSRYRQGTGIPQPNRIIFTGSFRFSPNYEGMVWFTEKVLPLLHEHCPGLQLTITGDHGGLSLPNTQGVNLVGFVGDIRPWVAQAICSVVPIFEGGGTRLKIIEAMAIGTPVISTSKGAEGLDVKNGIHLLIANSAEEFAGAIRDLIKNRELRQWIVKNGRELVEERYSWDAVLPSVLKLIESVCA